MICQKKYTPLSQSGKTDTESGGTLGCFNGDIVIYFTMGDNKNKNCSLRVNKKNYHLDILL